VQIHWHQGVSLFLATLLPSLYKEYSSDHKILKVQFYILCNGLLRLRTDFRHKTSYYVFSVTETSPIYNIRCLNHHSISGYLIGMLRSLYTSIMLTFSFHFILVFNKICHWSHFISNILYATISPKHLFVKYIFWLDYNTEQLNFI
jgi:hypothetical protein